MWSSPGGEAKVLKSHDDLNAKWHGRKSQKIVMVKENNEEQLSRSVQIVREQVSQNTIFVQPKPQKRFDT